MLLLLLLRLFIFRLNSNMHFSWARCAFLPHCPTTPAMPTPQPSDALCHASSAVSLSLSLCWSAAPFTVCLLIVITFVGRTGFKLHLCLPIGLSRCCLAFNITHTSCYPLPASPGASQWDFRFRNLIKERECVREVKLSLPVANELKQWKQQQQRN